MKKIFRSKVEMAILIPLALLLSTLGIYLLANRIWLAAIPVILVATFIVYLYKQTFYVLTGDDKLKIRSGFLYNKEIYVKSIKKIRQTRNHLASPALSPDRLEIFYNRYDRVLISPDHKSEFIKGLMQVNPRITIA